MTVFTTAASSSERSHKLGKAPDSVTGEKEVQNLLVDASFPPAVDNKPEALPFIGSPLLNTDGEVGAVVGPMFQPSARMQQGSGSALPIGTYSANLALVNQAFQGIHTILGCLGATYYPADQAEQHGIPVGHGTLVEYGYPGQAAEAAGIRGGSRAGRFTSMNGGHPETDVCVVGGDVIVAVDGRPIKGDNLDAWNQYMAACHGSMQQEPGRSPRAHAAERTPEIRGHPAA